MSGKSYTMKEMLSIVEYLVKNKFYGDIRGRKMWMDLANSQITTRTWQSLKETFLKRILPDIHNPYYNLTTEQINSFRAGYDVADRNKNKLEIHTISDDSNSNANSEKDIEQPKDGNEGETTAGENVKCSKINPQRTRSSADTIILDNCYETAEDIKKDLESNDPKKDGQLFAICNKSFRDCITYSEPLTPMLQEVLDDFASEPDSDRETQMEIVDNVPENDNLEGNTKIPALATKIPHTKSIATDIAKNAKGLSAEVVEEVLTKELDSSGKSEKNFKKKPPTSITATEEIPVINLDNENSETGTEKDDIVETVETTKFVTAENLENPVSNDSDNNKISVANDSHKQQTTLSGGINNSNCTEDASLPNNPEGLEIKNPINATDKSKETHIIAEEVLNKSNTSQSPSQSTRKRSLSVDTLKNMENKRKKFEIKLKLSPKKDKKPTTECPPDEKDQINLKLSLKKDNKSTIESAPKKIDKKSDNVELKKKSDNNEQSKPDEDEQGKSDKDSYKSDIMKKPQVENIPSELSKPLTSLDTEKSSVRKEPAVIINPCLQNVSLYDEQFNKAKYNMSESSDTEQNKKETEVNKQEGTVAKREEIVVLKSNSESEVEENHSSKKRPRAGVLTSKSERDKAVANMFGFTSGGVGSKRKRQLSRRRRTISHNNVTPYMVSNSSEWTSADTESETFVSPPRARKNRPTKKYLKPRSAKILSLEEEGGLFVMYRKKIYPLVKDGKIVKNYLTYLAESDSDEGEIYWKQKYVEEKKRAEELKKLLEQTKEPPPSRESHSPILQPHPLRKSKSSHDQIHGSLHGTNTEICLPVHDGKKEESKVNPPEKIKIKFTKNNEEVHLEGHWPQIHPVLEQVVHIFHKEVEPTVSEAKSKMILEPPEQAKEPSSGISTPIIITPVDPEVHEKVNQIETEIFKEIEERDREEHSKPIEQDNHVTKRKIGRPRKSSSSTSHSPVKRNRKSMSESKESEDSTSTNKKTTDTENTATENKGVTTRRLTRTPQTILKEPASTNGSEQIQTRRSKQNLDTSKTKNTNNDEEIRYMLPPRNKKQILKSPANKNINQKPRKSSPKTPKIFSSPDNFSLNSLDSTQGYQDSDVSPLKTELRRKKKINTSSFTIKTRNSLRRSTRRRSHPYVYCDAYNDSSNSSVVASVKIIARENSSLNTEAYRSESYQLLMPQATNSFRPLQPIDETYPIGNESNFVRHLRSMSKNEISIEINSPSGQITSDVGSSSVSLPMSPELSVVENMSISKDILNSIEDYPTLNEMQSNEMMEQTLCRKYMISDVDISVPLMQQNCGLESCNGTNDVSNDPKTVVTESLIKEIDNFKINDQVTATDTLDKKLHDLLLESAKKMTRTDSSQNEECMMDVDVTNVEVKKKAKSKKRCSTPRKRKTSQKSKPPNVEPLVEEEHVESYSHNDRKSCPPLFQTFVCEDKDINEEINIANLTIAAENLKGKKKKKNIIKVKIQRPKTKTSNDKDSKRSSQDGSRISVFSDSGINETESAVFLPINDSVDLIHNHSETCLQANECVGDSIEFVENSKSVITLGDSMQSGDNVWNNLCEYNDPENTLPDLFCNNARDMKSFSNNNIEKNSNNTVYHSPLGTEVNNSLLTEDLSDEPTQPPAARPSKWYLLSEDETTNTNMVGQGSAMLNVGTFGSSLKQLFPITCAVPDLSTISELSKENEDSRKPVLDLNSLTGEDFNSQSIFDSNF